MNGDDMLDNFGPVGTNGDGAVCASEAPSPELQAKMDEERRLQGMQEAMNCGQGIALGISGMNPAQIAQMHYDAAADIRSRAFYSAMQVHAHRATGHEEILKTARAFETYLKGE